MIFIFEFYDQQTNAWLHITEQFGASGAGRIDNQRYNIIWHQYQQINKMDLW